MLKRCIAIMALMSLSFNGIAQGSLWSKTSSRLHTMSQSEIPQESAQFTLNTNALSNLLINVPSRLNQKTSNTLINLPNENGEFNQYEVLEASNFHPDLAAKYPNIKSYIARGIDTNSMARISYGPSLGLTIAITNLDRATTLIKPIDVSNNVYAVYSRASIIEDASAFECSTNEEAKSAFNQTSYDENRNADDSTLRRYRVAISTTGEYSQFYLDGTETTDEERKGKVLEALNQSLTRINGIFERDFAVTMELVPNNDAVIFLNASTDPYNVSNSAVQNAIDNAIGNDNYDVGHLYAYEGSIYGNAGCIACVCTPGAKGQAFTVHSAPDSDNFNMIASHEFGHQFGGWHVQSSANCRSSAGLQEVEPGSGSTIMGYAGICSPNVQAGPDDYFNYVDIRDVAQWTINDSSCAQLIDLSNNAPTTSAGDDYTIPRSTAFVLEGEGSDPDADDISFCWEENDPENPNSTDTPQPTRVFGPMFRSKLPVASPDRYMPQLDDVVAGNLLATWEMLPSVSRTMDFVLTVRDNALNGGQTASDEMTVTVTDTAGPFVVTSQATPETWNVGENTTITWDVANTNVAPVSATEVDVFLSIDGGYTYPYALATGIVNDGSEVINIPNVPTTTEARVMVRGANNIFFAINASNFEIQASEFVMNFTEVNQAVCKPDDAIYNFTYNTFLGFDETTTFSALNLPDGAIATFNPPTAINDDTNVVLTISNTNAVANGTYDITVNGMSPSAEKNTAISLEVYDSGLVAPALQSPANNATAVDVNATFEWLEDPNAANYELEVALDAAFNTVVIDVTTTAITYQVSGLDFNTTYFWRVRSTNTCGISAYSSINEFITFCVAPSNVAISNTLVDTAQLAWLENGNANTWEVEVIAQGAMPTGVGISTTDNPYTISGLSSLTTYDAYVRSACGGENYSDWTGPITFTTAADFCNGDPFYDSGGPDGNYSNNEFVTTVIAPSGASNNITVEFTAFELESGYDYLFIYDGPDTGAPLLGQFSGTTNPGPFTSTHPTGTLTFVFTSDGSVTYSGWEAIVSCNFISCPNPGDLAASDITLSSATINWTSGGNETSWELEYGESGFAQGSGTTLQVATNPYDLTGLDLETTYDVYLRGNCGANPGEDDSVWIGPATFSTLGLDPPGPLSAELTNDETGEVSLTWSEPSAVAGSWLFNYSNGCDGTYFQVELLVYNDGTFYFPDFGDGGTWELVGDQITFDYNNGFLIVGTVDGNSMIGTYDGGCWYADKIQGDTTDYIIPQTSIAGQLIANSGQTATIVADPSDFIEFNLYRDGQLLATTTATAYIDTLPDYGTYQYYVTAVYDEGESSPTNIEIIEWIDFCSGSHFYDSGGVDGNYQNNEDITTVIEPGSGFDRVTVTFISFELEGCCDYLAVYDGLDTNAPFLGQYNGTSIPESFTANNASGALTFRFTSDSSVTYSGWDAIITCESISCPDPTNLEVAEVTIDTALITWTPGGDETMWEVEFGDPGFTQGTGAVVQVDAPFAEFSNLLPNSSLDVYIRANCGINPGEDDSNWIGPVTFTTLDTTAPGFLTAELTNSNDGEVTLSWGEPSDFTGSWLLNFDHGCNNNYNQVEIIFNEDNTFFIPSENNSGTWELTGDQITWTFDNDFQYNGTLTGNNYMEGVMDSGGCWFADKLNGQDYIEYVVGDLSSNQLVNENANQVITIAPQVFDFIEYNVYRDSQLIASTIDTNYIDTLPEFGTYDYYVTAVYDEGESDPSNTETVVWDNLSVEGFNLKDLKLYPNPVSSILTVSYTQNISSVEVFSILGQNVLNIDTDSNINTIDMSQLEAGTYFVKVYVGTNFNIYKVVKK